ncbi:Lysosomal alpha-mannosidase [Armadillidium vulgare]|nr:Lysosomal alpha-mannosidase [Armadillidium vulgare]
MIIWTLALVFSASLHLINSNPSCPEIKPDMINVHLVCHTHDDVGWLKTVDQYYYGSRKDITGVGVQYILDSVISVLLTDPAKKFIYVESAFFFRWWDEQNEQMQNNVKQLVNNGQLEFINGGWCMNDEGIAHYNSIIDQMTVGLVRLNETFGPAAFPRIGWQIDPFGHSSEQASLFAQMGMDAQFFARLDFRDKENRWAKKEMETIWKPSNSLGALPNHYEPPSGFCFDNLCRDDPIMDDPRLEDYNKDDNLIHGTFYLENISVTNIFPKVQSFIDAVNDEVTGFISNQNIIMLMGSDFNYVSANSYYKNLDKVIRYVNELQSNGSKINVMYSTPSCYVDALHSENLTWPVNLYDFFPYASVDHSYFTGYFTTRPTLKGFERQANNVLQVCKQFASLTGSERDESISILAEAIGVIQHHDAITGTSKQHVADDYSKRLAKGVDASRSLLSKGFSYITGNDETTEFTYCPLLNISSCSFVEGKTSFVVNVYNSIGRPKSFYVRVPVEDSLGYTVQDQQGNFLESQVLPLPDQVVNLPGRTSTAKYDLVFYAQDIPALGALQYLVEVASTGNKNGRISVNSMKRKTIKGEEIVVGKKVTQDWRWYKGMDGDDQTPDTQGSGAYIFRPDGDSRQLSEQVVTTVLRRADGAHGSPSTYIRRRSIRRVSERTSIWGRSGRQGASFLTSQKSGLSAPLPDNIHLLTLEPWSSSGTWLLRLENFYEVNESSLSGSVDVDLESLFSEWTVSNIRELVLGANAYKEDVVRLRWNSQSEETKPVVQEEKKVKSSEAVYSFTPMQIRTFLTDVTQK